MERRSTSAASTAERSFWGAHRLRTSPRVRVAAASPNLRATTVLREVQEFSPYSSKMDVAWDVVKKVSNSRRFLQIHPDRDGWRAAFGEFPMVTAGTAPIAICLAALRVRGLEVGLSTEAESE